jgi:hypothetical protein
MPDRSAVPVAEEPAHQDGGPHAPAGLVPGARLVIMYHWVSPAPPLVWAQRLPGGGELFYGSGQAPSWRIHSPELGLHPSVQPGSSAGGIPLSPRRLAPHSWRRGVRALKSSHPLPSALASEEQGEGGESLPCSLSPTDPDPPLLPPGAQQQRGMLLGLRPGMGGPYLPRPQSPPGERLEAQPCSWWSL